MPGVSSSGVNNGEEGDNSDIDDGFSIVRRGKGGASKGNNSAAGAKKGSDVRDGSGLLANRQRGFSSPLRPNTRVPTSNLHDMQARDGALVSKFMTFLCRKNTFVY